MTVLEHDEECRKTIHLYEPHEIKVLREAGTTKFKKVPREEEYSYLFGLFRGVKAVYDDVPDGIYEFPTNLIKDLIYLNAGNYERTNEIYHGHCHGCITNKLRKSVCMQCYYYYIYEDPQFKDICYGDFDKIKCSGGGDHFMNLEEDREEEYIDRTKYSIALAKGAALKLASENNSSYFI